MWSNHNLWLIKSAVTGSTVIFAQTLLPDGQSGLIERLGTAGLLVLAAYFMLRYFMAELSKKDAQVQVMMADHALQLRELSERHIAMIITELKDSQELKTRLITTMQELTLAVRGRRTDGPLQ